MARGRSAAAAHPHVKLTDSAHLHPRSTYHPVAHEVPKPGIYAHRQPFPGSPSFTATNFYQGFAGGTWYMVWAGSTTGASGVSDDRGAVQIFTGNIRTDSDVAFVGKFTAPAGYTTLHITSESAGVLTLTDTQGAKVRFDLSRRAYT